MTYPEVIRYLESFINYEKIPAYPYKESLKLERSKGFLAAIGNPQDSLKCIHVAGSKGKGSVCAFIAYILREAGFKAGLYTSPHLSDFRERVRILKPHAKGRRPEADFEGMISQRELAGLVERLKPAIEKYNHCSQYGPLSFFEVYTALALIYFKEKKVDFAVLETGLGGRLDATNVVNPLACAITPISYEHTDKLGSTLREIAREKSGIIKGQAPVITAPQKAEAMQVIRNHCRQVGAELCEAGKYVKVKANLKIRLLGKHQIVNAAVAVGVMRALEDQGIKVGSAAIRKGLEHTRWPGRCEPVGKRPWVILDGAQNVASAQAIKQAVKDNFKYQRLILVLGISRDKDIKGICQQLKSLADAIILTKASNPRASSPAELARHFRDKETYTTDNVKLAKALARRLVKKQDLILVTGSLFVVGEYRDVK